MKILAHGWKSLGEADCFTSYVEHWTWQCSNPIVVGDCDMKFLEDRWKFAFLHGNVFEKGAVHSCVTCADICILA